MTKSTKNERTKRNGSRFPPPQMGAWQIVADKSLPTAYRTNRIMHNERIMANKVNNPKNVKQLGCIS